MNQTPGTYAYALLPVELADPSVDPMNVIVIVFGQMGYNETTWTLPRGIAQKTIDAMNANNGISYETAVQWFGYSMFGWPADAEAKAKAAAAKLATPAPPKPVPQPAP